MDQSIAPLPTHSLYKDDEAVRQLSQIHLDAGRTVFQLWLLDPNEREHSFRVLEALQLPVLSDIISLGCGVGGMEKHWTDLRPDLHFTLLNQSQAQLDLCVCPGKKVHARIETFYPQVHECTLISYALGHVHARETLEHALTYTLGPVIVLDAFDSSPEFNSHFEYNAPLSSVMTDLGFTKLEVGPWIVNPHIVDLGLESLVRQSTPGLWISE